MNLLSKIYCQALLILLFICTVFSQGIYDTYTGFTTPTTPVLPPSEIHPSLFFNSSQILEIKNRASSHPYYTSLWNSITSNINKYKGKTASSQNINERPRMAKYCAFGWLINGDTTARNKAIEALLIAFDNVPRTTTPGDFGGDYDEIYRATWLQNYCEAYDWVASVLNNTQDSIIRSKLSYEVKILRNHMVDSSRYAPRPHNHRSKPAYAVATGALTFSSDSRASDWLQFALTQLNTVTKYQYSFDGIYREGGHYHLYGLVNGIPFLWHYKNVSGVDLFPYYKPAFEWPVIVRMGQGWIPLFEDSFLKPFPGQMAARAYTTSATSLHPTASLASVMQWSYFNTNLFTNNYTGATNDVCWDIDEYILYDNTIPQVAPSVSPTVNMVSGQTVFRKNWNYNDRTNRYLIFHGVAEADNHNHPDNLSFIIEAENSVMATGPGYGPAGASDPRRNSWYLTPHANNLITVDSLPPIDVAVNVTPKNHHFLDSDFFDYAEKEAVYANGANWKRGISFPHQNYWVVRDIVRSLTQRTSRWYLHSRGTLTTNGMNAKWTTKTDKYGTQAIMDAFSVSSGGSSYQTFSGWLSLYWGDEESAPYVILQNSDTVSLFFSILYPRPAVSLAPNIVNISNSSRLAFTLNTGDTTDVHIFQKNNQTQTAGGLTTNGIYSWISSASSIPKSFAVTDGTNLQWNGSHLLSSTQVITFAASFINSSRVVAVLDSLLAPATIDIKLPFPAVSLTEFLLNNQPITFTVVGDSTVRIITAQQSSIVSVQSGNWNSGTTWSIGTVPTTANDIVITSGHTVTINIANAECDDLTINGTVEFNNSSSSEITINGNIIINPGGIFTTKSTTSEVLLHRLSIKGNLTSFGTFDMRVGTNPDVGVGEITFGGFTNTIINLNAGHDINSVTINKQGGARVILASNIEQNNNGTTAPAILYLINGIVETGSYEWHVKSTASSAGVHGGSISSFIIGTLVRYLPWGNNLIRKFPIGDNDEYRPIELFILQGTSNSPIAVRAVNGNANNGTSTFTGNIDKVSAVRYYEIKNRSSASFDFTLLKLSYGHDDGVTAGNTDLRVATSTDERSSWYDRGPNPSGPKVHITSLATPPTEISSDSILPHITLTAGAKFYASLARQTGTITNSLESPGATATISGIKYFDANGDSTLTGDDPAQGWVINLYKNGVLIQFAMTDEYGEYVFTHLSPGTYTIEESLKVNWSQTYPHGGIVGAVSQTYGNNAGPWAYSVTVSAGDFITGKDFGNTPVPDTICRNVNVFDKWNLISVPVIAEDMSKISLFPTAVSSAFGYSANYSIIDTLKSGKGYWLKFGSAENISICGIKVMLDTILVSAGWNLIGIFERDISIDSITTIPPNILISSFYGYNNGYYQATTLEVGNSYWVKVNQSGNIVLPGVASGSIIKREIEKDLK